MTLFIAAGIRLLIIYIAIRLVWSMLSGRKNKIPPGKNKASFRSSRFDSSKHNVSDGDFEEL
jgi:hypothetical protein